MTDQQLAVSGSASEMSDKLMQNFQAKRLHFHNLQELQIQQIENDLQSPFRSSRFSIEDEIIISQTEKQGFSNQIWKNNALRILYIVVKFITYILTNSEKFKFTFVTDNQFKAINDSTAFYDFYIKNSFIRSARIKKSFFDKLKRKVMFTRLTIMFNNLFNYVQIVNPNSYAKVIWDCIVLQVLIVQMVYIPIKIGYFLTIYNVYFDLFLNKFPFIILTIEIFLNFKTAYYYHGILIVDQKVIAKRYLNSRFPIDIIVLLIFSFRYIDFNFIPEYLEIFVLFRITKIKILIENFEETLNLRENFSTIIDLIRLVSMFLFISHLFACSWHFLALNEIKYGYNDTWLEASELLNKQWYIRYIASVYWSQITMLTIGYGDVHAQNEIEQVFVIFVGLISSVVFGYTISNIEQIFSAIEESKKKQRHKLSIISSFIRKRNLNKTLSMKVKKFFEYFFRLDHEHDQECEEMMNSLAQNLKCEVKIDFYKKYFRNCKLFKQTFSDEFINKICMITKEKMFLPEQTIFQLNEQVNEFYFIIDGEVDLLTETKKHAEQTKIIQNLIRSLHSGYTVGERFFFTEEFSNYVAKAQTFTTIAYFTRDEFFKLLQLDQNEWEKFQQSKNKLLMNEQLSGCELCRQNHTVFKCPFVFYQPNITKVIKRQNHFQNRIQYLRFSRASFRTRLFKEEAQEAALILGMKEVYYDENQLDDSFFNRYDLGFMKQKYFNQNSQDYQNFKLESISDDTQQNQQNVQRVEEPKNSLVVPRSDKHQNSIVSLRRCSAQGRKKGKRQQSLLKNFKSRVEEVVRVSFDQLEDIKDKKQPQNITITTLNQQGSTKLIVHQVLHNLEWNIENQFYQDYLNIYPKDSIPELDTYRQYLFFYHKWNLDNVLEDIKKQIVKKQIFSKQGKGKGKGSCRKNIISLNSMLDMQKKRRQSKRIQDSDLQYTRKYNL